MATKTLLPDLEEEQPLISGFAQTLLPDLNEEQAPLPGLEEQAPLPEKEQTLLPDVEETSFLRDLDDEEVPEISGDPRDEGFGSVLSRTVDELQASGWAGVRVLGEVFNSDRLIDAGNRGVAFNDQQIAKRGRPMIAEEVEDLGDAMTFIKQGMAQILPSVAVSMPTAIGGAKAGAALGTFAGPAGPVVGGLLGGALGAFLPSFVLSTGEVDREMKARAGEDFESPGAAMAGGAMVASLDVASIAFGLKPLMPVLLKKTTLKEVTDKLVTEGVEKGVAKAAVAQAVKASLAEGVTEASQEGIEDFMAEAATGLASEEGQLQSALLNAFLLGSIGGGTLGSVSGAISQYGVNQRKKSEREVKEQMDRIEEEVQKEVNIAGQTWQDMSREELIEGAKRRNIKLRKNASNDSIIKELTDYEVLKRRAQLQANYFMENFGALTAQEKQERLNRREELRNMDRRELLKLADSKVLKDDEGGPEMKLIIVNRKDSDAEVINKILDQELLEKRALTGGASIIYAAAQEPKYIARLEQLEQQSRKELSQELKTRGLTASIVKDGKKKTATNKEMAKMIMDFDTFMILQKERTQNYLRGEGYSKGYKKQIQAKGPLENVNFYEIDKTMFDREGMQEKYGSWEEFVEQSTGVDGEAVAIRFAEDGTETLNEGDNLQVDQDGTKFEVRDVQTDEEGNVVGGTGLFNKYAGAKDRAATNVQTLRFEMTPENIRPANFFGGIMGGLKHWFAPSGPLGWEAFMLSRDRLGRIRAMNKMANQMGDKVNMAVAAAVANGKFSTPAAAEQALSSALRRTTKRYKRDDVEIEELWAERASIMADIKQQRANIEMMELFRDGSLAYEELSIEQQEQLKRFNTKQNLENLRLQLMIWRGDLEDVNQILAGQFRALPREEKQALNQEQRAIMNNKENALLAPTSAAYALPEELRDSFLELRGFIDMMSTRILREVPQEILASKKGGKALGEVIQENIGSYMTRSYRIFEAAGGYDPLSWWNRTMPTKSAKVMRQKVADVRALLENAKNPDGTKKYSKSRVEREIRMIGQGRVGEQQAEEIGGIFGRGEPGTEEAMIQDMAQELVKRRKRIPKEVRALMGEVTNPGEAAAVTTARLASVLESNRFWQRMAILNEMPGQRLFSPVPVPKGDTAGIAPNWFAKETGLTVKVQSNGYNPFEGMYTTKEVAEVLGVAENYNMMFNNSSIWRNFVVAPKAYVQLGKIVLSPPAQIRNFLSAALFVVGNGHFIGFRNLPEAMKVVGHELWEQGVDEQGRPITARQAAQESYRDLLDLGVLNTSVRLGDLLASWRLASSGMFEGPGDFVAATSNPFRQMYRRAEEFYTAADDFWKVVAYASELQAVKKAFPTEADFNQLLAHAKDLGMSYTIDRQSFEQAQKELAAFYVRQTVPNYDYVGRFAEALRTGPAAVLGNFIAFPTEIVRTSANILTIGAAEIQSDNSAIRKRGGARLAGYGTAAHGVGAAAQAIGQAVSDIDDEDIEAARKFLPDWAQNNLIIPIEKKTEAEGGGFDFIDGSYIAVYDDLAKMVPTTLNEVSKAVEEGRSASDAVISGMTTAIANFSEPFLEPSIFAQASLDVLQNRNSNTGRPIWNEAEGRGKPLGGVGDQSMAYLNYFWDRVAPGIWTAGEKVYRGGQEGEKAYDRFGTKQEFGDALSSFFGIKVSRVNPSSSLSFALTDLLNEQRDAEKIFTKQVYNKGAVTPQELLDAYLAMQKSNYFVNQDIFSTFKAAELLNIREAVLNNTKKERLSKKQRIMLREGANIPLKNRKALVSLRKDFDKQTEAIEEAEELPSGRFFPIDDLAEIYNYFKNLPLLSQPQAEVVREEEAEYFE